MKLTIFAIILGAFLLFCVFCAFSKASPEIVNTNEEVAANPVYNSGADWYLDPIQYMNPQRWDMGGTREGMKVGGKTVGGSIGGITLSDKTFGYCEGSTTILKSDAEGSNCTKPVTPEPTTSTPTVEEPDEEAIVDAVKAEVKESKLKEAIPAPSNEEIDALASAKLKDFLSNKTSNSLPTILTEWMAKNAPKPEEAPYEPVAPKNQSKYDSAYSKAKTAYIDLPLPDYKGDYPRDEPVQTNASEMKPGISAYNTSTVFIPPPIGGGQPKNTGSNMNSCPEPAPCPACARCPEPSFDCKKVPNYSSTNSEYLPMPVLTDFSTFGM